MRSAPIARFLGAMLPIIGLCAALPAVAAPPVPQTLQVQGRLFDASAKPVTSNVSLQFRVYGAAQGGKALWSETHKLTPEGGWYSVSLGSLAPLQAGLFDGSPRWLDVPGRNSDRFEYGSFDATGAAMVATGGGHNIQQLEVTRDPAGDSSSEISLSIQPPLPSMAPWRLCVRSPAVMSQRVHLHPATPPEVACRRRST